VRTLFLFWLAACGGSSDDGVKPEDTSLATPSTPDTGTPVTRPDACAELGLPVRTWVDAPDDDALFATAADLTLKTRVDTFDLSAMWTGCDTLLFIPDTPAQNGGWPTGIWERDVDALFERLPDNVQLFFVSTAAEKADRDAALDGLQAEIDDYFRGKKKKKEYWEPRIHMLTKQAADQDGWLGAALRSPGWGVYIDRLQRLNYIGSFADYTRYDAALGWFAPNLSMAANEAVHANFAAEREARLEAEAVTIIPVFRDDLVAGRVEAEVELPDPATMAGFDTVALDLTMGCDGDGEFGTCPAWDYMAYLYMCDLAVEPTNPHADEVCQPYVAETLGTCSGTPLPDTGGHTGDTAAAPGDTAGADTGMTDTAGTSPTTPPPPRTCRAPADCEDGTPTEWSCDGFIAAIPADIHVGACTAPGGAAAEGNYTCRADGSGYDDLVCGCGTEVGRWITTYHRIGRWEYDISPMLPMLSPGGKAVFRFDTSGPYLLDMDLRLRNTGKDARPSETTYLFSGGTANLDYNDAHPPIVMPIPADAVKVELATVISQHGADGNNCGEFCDIAHHFTVNGDISAEIVRSFPESETPEACMDQVADGTVPNQYGTWWYGRAGWCPGKEVPTVVHDITDQVVLGADNTFEYRALYRGEDYPGSASIRMRSWIVVSR
jgi:hypothetical protein